MSELTAGCTGLSFILSRLGFDTPGEYCCDEHDVAYEQGGSLAWKVEVDARFFRCVQAGVGTGAAVAGWLAVTLNPYAYWAWGRG